MEKKVNVLLSVYNPNIRYLTEQLESIDNQDYKNIELLFYDDCPDKRTDTGLLSEILKNVSFRIIQGNNKNLGYLKAFELLSKNADGEYCVFCDQDDIWMPNKISSCIEFLEANQYSLISTDKEIIDGEGNTIISSFDKSREGLLSSLKNNDDIFVSNFFSTFADGMCLFGRTDFIQKCIPFSRFTGHDKWLIACACAEGKYGHFLKVLVKYRRHNNNVSGKLKDISSIQDYREKRVNPNYFLLMNLKERYPKYKYISPLEKFNNARKKKNIITLYRYRYLSKKIAYFDIATTLIPDRIMNMILKTIKRYY